MNFKYQITALIMARFDQFVFNRCIFGQMTRNYLFEILDFHDFLSKKWRNGLFIKLVLFFLHRSIYQCAHKNLQVGHYCLVYKKLHILQLCCRILGCNIVTANSSSCSLHLLQFSTISTVCRLPSAICHLPSTVYPPLSIVHRLPSTIFRLLSTNRNRKLSVCKLWL